MRIGSNTLLGDGSKMEAVRNGGVKEAKRKERLKRKHRKKRMKVPGSPTLNETKVDG